MNNLFINWWQEKINEVNNIHITLNRLSEAGRTGREELGEWIPFVRLRAQGITKGQLPFSDLISHFSTQDKICRGALRALCGFFTCLVVVGSHVEIPALVPPASAVTTQTLLALTYGSLGWGPSQPPSSLKLVMQLRNMLGSACVLGVGDTGFPPGSHGTLSFF